MGNDEERENSEPGGRVSLETIHAGEGGLWVFPPQFQSNNMGGLMPPFLQSAAPEISQAPSGHEKLFLPEQSLQV